jgi:hypothetical protein
LKAFVRFMTSPAKALLSPFMAFSLGARCSHSLQILPLSRTRHGIGKSWPRSSTICAKILRSTSIQIQMSTLDRRQATRARGAASTGGASRTSSRRSSASAAALSRAAVSRVRTIRSAPASQRSAGASVSGRGRGAPLARKRAGELALAMAMAADEPQIADLQGKEKPAGVNRRAACNFPSTCFYVMHKI